MEEPKKEEAPKPISEILDDIMPAETPIVSEEDIKYAGGDDGVTAIFAANDVDEALRAWWEVTSKEAKEDLDQVKAALRSYYGPRDRATSDVQRQFSALELVNNLLTGVVISGNNPSSLEAIRSVTLQVRAVKEGLRVRTAKIKAQTLERNLLRASAMVLKLVALI